MAPFNTDGSQAGFQHRSETANYVRISSDRPRRRRYFELNDGGGIPWLPNSLNELAQFSRILAPLALPTNGQTDTVSIDVPILRSGFTPNRLAGVRKQNHGNPARAESVWHDVLPNRLDGLTSWRSSAHDRRSKYVFSFRIVDGDAAERHSNRNSKRETGSSRAAPLDLKERVIRQKFPPTSSAGNYCQRYLICFLQV